MSVPPGRCGAPDDDAPMDHSHINREDPDGYPIPLVTSHTYHTSSMLGPRRLRADYQLHREELFRPRIADRGMLPKALIDLMNVLGCAKCVALVPDHAVRKG